MAFKPGEIVLKSKPYVHALLEKCNSICDYCFNSPHFKNAPEEMKRCSGCQYVHYCSKSCQIKSWKKFHKEECEFLKEKPDAPGIIRMAARIAIKLKKGDSEFEEMPDGRKISFKDLVSNSKDHLEREGLDHVTSMSIGTFSPKVKIKRPNFNNWQPFCPTFFLPYNLLLFQNPFKIPLTHKSKFRQTDGNKA